MEASEKNRAFIIIIVVVVVVVIVVVVTIISYIYRKNISCSCFWLSAISQGGIDL